MKNKIIIIISILIVVSFVVAGLLGVKNNYSNNKTYITNEVKYKLESIDTSDEVVSDNHYRSVGKEELNYIKSICDKYDLDLDTATVEYDITTDTYIVRANTATLFIEMETGIVDVEYIKQIDY